MKILASDFDDTIYFLEDEEKNKKNIEAIKKFIANGNIFCIITGRNYTDLKDYLIKYKIPYSYLICEDGAKIFNNMDYCIETVLLDKKEIEVIEKILTDLGQDYYLDDGYNMTLNQNDCVKIVVNCSDEEEKERILNILKSNVNCHIYASRTHINIIHRDVNKAIALKKLFNLEELNYNLLHVIGDNDNDYEMLKIFPGGIVKEHHKILDSLNKKEYDTLSDYIEELMKN